MMLSIYISRLVFSLRYYLYISVMVLSLYISLCNTHMVFPLVYHMALSLNMVLYKNYIENFGYVIIAY